MIERYCPVCGFEFPAMKRPLLTGDMCGCCLFEFGVNDDLHGYSYADWREKWINAGCPWPVFGMKLKPKPNDWDPQRQLLNIGIVLLTCDKNSSIPPPWDVLKAKTRERKRYLDDIFERAVTGLPESSLRIFARNDGNYGVYDPESGAFGVYEPGGSLDWSVNLRTQGQTPQDIDSYLQAQGAPIQAIPRPSTAAEEER
ncbi:MAG TPA: hypothetical protein VIJ12_07410 [Candidatus Baltobacteraceae bacterium]